MESDKDIAQQIKTLVIEYNRLLLLYSWGVRTYEGEPLIITLAIIKAEIKYLKLKLYESSIN